MTVDLFAALGPLPALPRRRDRRARHLGRVQPAADRPAADVRQPRPVAAGPAPAVPGRKPTTQATTAARPRRVAPRPPRRPPVGDRPILWKEVFVDAGLKLGGFGKVVVLGLVGAVVRPGRVHLLVHDRRAEFMAEPGIVAGGRLAVGRLRPGMNIYLRSAGTVATCLVFLAVAIRGAGVDLRRARPAHARRPARRPRCRPGRSSGASGGGACSGCALGVGVAPGPVGASDPGDRRGPPGHVPGRGRRASPCTPGRSPGSACSARCTCGPRCGPTMAAIVASMFLAGGYFLMFAFCCVLPLSCRRAADGRTSARR